jgi:carboxyl-terminal processing protease
MTASKNNGFRLLAVLLLLNAAIGFWIHAGQSKLHDSRMTKQRLQTVALVHQLLQDNYIDPKMVNSKKMFDAGLQAMVASVGDRFCSYMPVADYQDIDYAMQGGRVGIGVTVERDNGHLRVGYVVPESPAAIAGIQVGDLISAISGISMVPPRDDYIERLNGAKGAPVVIELLRPGQEKPLTVSVKREFLKISSLRMSELFSDGTLYLRISEFSLPMPGELKQVLEKYQDQATGLVIDLRDNPGGVLVTAGELASLFLPPNQVVVSTVARHGERKQQLTRAVGLLWTKPVVILINKGSASAAEAFSGCLHDHYRAVLVGTTSFGKASVQQVIEMPDGGALRVTVAGYETPAGRMIHGRGIDPDLKVAITRENREQFWKAWIAAGKPDKPFPEADPQLAAALTVLRTPGRYQELLEMKHDPVETLVASPASVQKEKNK